VLAAVEVTATTVALASRATSTISIGWGLIPLLEKMIIVSASVILAWLCEENEYDSDPGPRARGRVRLQLLTVTALL
jgi:hypothetical protein